MRVAVEVPHRMRQVLVLDILMRGPLLTMTTAINLYLCII